MLKILKLVLRLLAGQNAPAKSCECCDHCDDCPSCQ